MIVYIKCLCTAKDRILASEYRRQGAEVRVISKNPKYRQLAKKYGVKPPFKIVNRKAVEL